MRSFRALATRAIRRILSPLVPSRMMLPFLYWLQRIDGTCEAELVHLDRFCGSSGAALDIGANEGVYTYRLSKRFARVYAFEINDQLTGWITQYNPGNIEIIHCGLSSTAGMARFYIPVVRGLALAGWGSLETDSMEEASEYQEKELRVARLDDFGITNVGFVKMDVEGHEVEVLKGSAATIGQSRPIVLIEVQDRNLKSVDSWFLDINYRRCSLEDFLNLKGNKENIPNYIYVPDERMAELGIRV
jgi:FkbM family methyltransferase